ncbi:hypothetical protein [Candidatus Amarobacter glycogenicus]|uniref:hypothetical protein n=1 Tax=Candidatus Amarobacter glycogenicus TaxID=3140699 RepID=UPI002A163656|nr:hypothetical protein [Dehalococcoidia bacterium]
MALITETNVPHEDNIAYFGNGRTEARLVYNFSLPPLTLHAFHNGRADILATWAQTLALPSDRTTFFNFLASHDGIGLTPARGLLPETAVSDMAARVLRLGGQVSYRANPDGSQTAYELNINYLDALADPDAPDEPIDLIALPFFNGAGYYVGSARRAGHLLSQPVWLARLAGRRANDRPRPHHQPAKAGRRPP